MPIVCVHSEEAMKHNKGGLLLLVLRVLQLMAAHVSVFLKNKQVSTTQTQSWHESALAQVLLLLPRCWCAVGQKLERRRRARLRHAIELHRRTRARSQQRCGV